MRYKKESGRGHLHFSDLLRVIFIIVDVAIGADTVLPTKKLGQRSCIRSSLDLA